MEILSVLRNFLRLATIVVFVMFVAHVMVNPIDSQLFLEIYRASSPDYGPIFGGRTATPILLVYVFLSLKDLPQALAIIPRFVLVLGVVALLSGFWSVDPVSSLFAASGFVLMIIVPALLITEIGSAKVLRITWVILALLLTASVALATAGSPLAVMGGYHEGAWRGIFGHRNEFGPFAVAVLAFTLFLGRDGFPSFRVRAVIVAMAILAALMSRSASAIAAVPVVLAMGALSLSVRHGKLNAGVVAVSLSIIALTGALLAGDVVPLALDALGRDPSLSGRTSLWSASVPFIQNAPLGYGYGLGGGEQVLEAMRLASGWQIAPATHNSYLTLALDLGWPLAVAYALWIIMKALPLGRGKYDPAIVALASLVALAGMTESQAGPYLSLPFGLLLLLLIMSRTERSGVPDAHEGAVDHGNSQPHKDRGVQQYADPVYERAL